MTIAQQALETRRKIHRLLEGELIYIHPASTEELAYFGQFKYRRTNTERGEENIHFDLAIEFSFDQDYGLWVPKLRRDSTRHSIDGISNGGTNIYSGMYEIEGGLTLNNPYNLEFVKEVARRFS